LLAFVGEPHKGQEACHNNGVKTDNRLCNLRWDTRHANSRDRVAHGMSRNGIKPKLTESDVIVIRALSTIHSNRQLALRFGVHPATIWNIIHRRKWAHVA
jgi:hypothetical protein